MRDLNALQRSNLAGLCASVRSYLQAWQIGSGFMATFGQCTFYSGTGFVVRELAFIEEILQLPKDSVLARGCPGCSSMFFMTGLQQKQDQFILLC